MKLDQLAKVLNRLQEGGYKASFTTPDGKEWRLQRILLEETLGPNATLKAEIQLVEIKPEAAAA